MAKVQLGEFASAAEDLEHVTSRDPKYDSHRALGLLAHAFANSGQPDDADRLFRQVTELSTLTETEVNYASFLAAQNRPVEAREWATRVIAKKATLPRYLQRRERPLFRKASALLKKLPKVAVAIVFVLAMAAGPNQSPLFELRRSAVALAKAEGLALRAEERFRITPDGSGQIPYVIADATDGSGYRTGDSQLAVWALEEWERSMGGALRFRAADNARTARLRVRWLPWAEDAALGRMEPLMANGQTIASLDIRPDEDRLRPSIKRRVKADPLMRDVVLYYVCLHEVGHALGLSHSDNPRDVMWPGANGVTLPVYERYRHHLKSRDDIPHVSWLSSHDIARAQAIWSRTERQ
jgi:tetratricopeptide (TPR) repeat protein